jgi:hypothetical protein
MEHDDHVVFGDDPAHLGAQVGPRADPSTAGLDVNDASASTSWPFVTRLTADAALSDGRRRAAPRSR